MKATQNCSQNFYPGAFQEEEYDKKVDEKEREIARLEQYLQENTEDLTESEEASYQNNAEIQHNVDINQV